MTQVAILKTLIYHDIFKYPLKLDQISNLLIEKKANLNQIKRTVEKLIELQKIRKKHEYIYLKGRENAVAIRKRRERSSESKLKRAQLYANILKFVPTILFVGVSGALALKNSDTNDDIDLVVICKNNSIWTSRFLANLSLLLFKRHPRSKEKKDKACLNIFIEETRLKIVDQNIYTAHEICQLKPLWQREKSYQRFIKSNSWVKKYLPNWKIQSAQTITGLFYIADLLLPLEALLKSFQLEYMKSKITTEKITDSQLFFHPRNTQKWVLEEYKKRLKKYGLELNK